MAVEAGAEVLLLDDGLQNPALAKDLAFAVVDGESRFGNGLCIPAGPLRAPVAAQAPHVQALIVIGGDEAAALGGFGGRARQASPARQPRAGRPRRRAADRPRGGRLRRHRAAGKVLRHVATRRRPVVATRDFPDHHVFTAREIEALTEEAARRGALLATTEKDRVRLTARQAQAIVTLPVTLRFDDPAAVRAVLEGAFER